MDEKVNKKDIQVVRGDREGLGHGIEVGGERHIVCEIGIGTHIMGRRKRGRIK